MGWVKAMLLKSVQFGLFKEVSMKIIIIVLLVLLSVQVFASNPSSENYILQQSSLSSGNDPANAPASENYILQSISVGDLAGEQQTSTSYSNLPGYYLGPILGEILPPENVTIQVIDSNVTITWDSVAGATSYKVYSSDNPYSGFTEDTSGTFDGESWTAAISNEKKFYYVTAVN